MVYTWKEGSLPTCDKCGAQLQADVTDDAQSPAAGTDTVRNTHSDLKDWIFTWSVIAVVILIYVVIGFAFIHVAGKEGDTSRSQTGSTKNSVYVSEIGRTCYLDGEDWYDSTTHCWFWFNDEEAPAQWQYWYEGISSDYGDYGWLEYDMEEDAWFVEVSDGNWVHLPSGYDTSGLWHMRDEYENRY